MTQLCLYAFPYRKYSYFIAGFSAAIYFIVRQVNILYCYLVINTNVAIFLPERDKFNTVLACR